MHEDNWLPSEPQRSKPESSPKPAREPYDRAPQPQPDLIRSSSVFSHSDAPAKILADRYRLEDLLSAGGYGQDWRGFDIQRNCAVQVKLIKLRRGQDPQSLLSRLQPLSKLQHPGILPTLDVGAQDDTCFIIAPQLDANTLEERLQERPVSQRRAIAWTIQIAEAVEYAHQHGTAHGDLTPACIWLDSSQQLRVSDFGISENTTPPASPGSGGRAQGIAATKSTSQVDPTLDIRDLGRLLQRLLSEQEKSPRKKIPSAPSRPDEQAWLRVSQLPPALQKICQKALSPDPKQQYKSAGQFAKELRLFQRERQLKPVRRAVLGGGIMLPLLLAGWSSYRLLTQNPPSDSAKPLARFFQQVAELEATEQVRAVAEMLAELNPGFDGQLFETIEQGQIVALRLQTNHVSNIWPIAALKSLRDLDCSGPFQNVDTGILTDLSPLVELPLRRLRCDYNSLLEDLSPLAKLPLEHLNVEACKVRDLEPLRGLKLRGIVLDRNPIEDLSPLKGMPLEEVCLSATLVEELSPVVQGELKFLRAVRSPIKSLEPLRGSQLRLLEADLSQLSDIAPVAEMPQLIGLMVSAAKVDDLSPLRDHPSIRWLRVDRVQGIHVPLLDTLPALELVNGADWSQLRPRLLEQAENQQRAPSGI